MLKKTGLLLVNLGVLSAAEAAAPGGVVAQDSRLGATLFVVDQPSVETSSDTGTPEKFKYVSDLNADDVGIPLKPAAPMVVEEWSVLDRATFDVAADAGHLLPAQNDENLDADALYEKVFDNGSFAKFISSTQGEASAASAELRAPKTSKKTLKADKKGKRTVKSVKQAKSPTVAGSSTRPSYALYVKSLTLKNKDVGVKLNILDPENLQNGVFVLPLVFVTNKSESHFVGKEYEMTIGDKKLKFRLVQSGENGDIALVMHVQSISSSDVQLSVQEKGEAAKGAGSDKD